MQEIHSWTMVTVLPPLFLRAVKLVILPSLLIPHLRNPGLENTLFLKGLRREQCGEGASGGAEAPGRQRAAPGPRSASPSTPSADSSLHELLSASSPFPQSSPCPGRWRWGGKGGRRRLVEVEAPGWGGQRLAWGGPRPCRSVAGPGYLDMLSGEQTELPPVEMLVSMLSELSRLSVS